MAALSAQRRHEVLYLVSETSCYRLRGMVDHTKRRRVQYSGLLDPRQAAEGIRVACENARELADDAKLLLDNRRFARAVGLAILSIEESGKIGCLRSILLAASESELKRAWRDYRTHTSKNWGAGILDLVARLLATKGPDEIRLQDMTPLFDPSSDQPFIYDALKQVALYSDCFTKDRWSKPSSVINEGLARQIVLTASVLATQGSAIDSPEGLVLWMKHLAGSGYGHRETALMRMYEEALATGLLSAQEAHVVLRFVGGAPSSDRAPE